MKRVRLDQALVAKKLFDTVATAQLAIDERKITVNGSIAVSHGYMVGPGDELLVIVAPKYVSRGGLKLEAAIREFAYKGAAHQKAIADTSAYNWYSEELFARFAVREVRGSL